MLPRALRQGLRARAQALTHGLGAPECCSTGSSSCAGREWAALPAAQVLQQPRAWGAAWSSSATAAVPEDPPTSATGGGDAVSSSHGTDVTATIPIQALEATTAPVLIAALLRLQEAITDSELTPRQVVERLDKFIVGQADAKRAVANALRNRWRRHRIPSPMKEEIVPKNILMIGPTGCGKTEIARRLAKLADAPFVKVEATKFTEVGFHGRDVDQIIRDLVDNAVTLMKQKQRAALQEQITKAVNEKLLSALCGPHAEARTKADMLRCLEDGQLEDRMIETDIPASRGVNPLDHLQGSNVQELVISVKNIMGPGRRGSDRRSLKVSEARPLIEEAETERLVSSDSIQREAVQAAEQDGIVFIDEIDKIVVGPEGRYGADASSEGVQRDLLPIIEGSVVTTKYGNVNTDHILFICSGAFHSCKPADMLAELQGRLPIRVELKGLTQQDFFRILTEPEHNMVKQQTMLLATEGVTLTFTEAAIREVSKVAEEVNTAVDNIGARRLHTIMERILEDISFEAPDRLQEAQAAGQQGYKYVVDKDDVKRRVEDLLKKQDLSKFVL